MEWNGGPAARSPFANVVLLIPLTMRFVPTKRLPSWSTRNTKLDPAVAMQDANVPEMKFLVRVLLILAILYAGLVGYVAARQDRYFYQPIQEPEAAL